MSTVDFDELVATAKRAAAALRDAGIPFLLAGGLAAWVRGGPPTEHDIDFVIRPEHAEKAQETLTAAGMRAERPPEEWLYKAYDGEILIDLIFGPEGPAVDESMFERADDLPLQSLTVPVMHVDDILASKLMALTEHNLDYESLLELVRPLREQVGWDAVKAQTGDSPFARAFFVLAEGLGLAPDAAA